MVYCDSFTDLTFQILNLSLTNCRNLLDKLNDALKKFAPCKGISSFKKKYVKH